MNNKVFLEESDTSMTRGLDEELSLDEEDPDETIDILNDARESLNINTNRNKQAQPVSRKRNAPKDIPTAKRSKTTGTVSATSSSTPNSSAPTSSRSTISATSDSSFSNSSKWGKEIRPPFLQDDEVFNKLSLESAANQIMQWMTTKAMITSNELKEKKANNAGGKEKADEPIKVLTIEAGEDDATSKLHAQRFMFRTPLKDPKDYWSLYPRKWTEVNKSIFLEHVGLETIISPRTLELLHDRASVIEIKMFLTINVSVGRAGSSKKQNLRTLDDGSTELVCSDDWLTPTSINQLLEAIDNLAAAWVVMWPGEWSVATLRRVITLHQAFGDITVPELRKRLLESFLNDVLKKNSSNAARKKLPMDFEKVNSLAKHYLENKRNYERAFNLDTKKKDFVQKDNGGGGEPTSLFKEVQELKKRIGGLKLSGGKMVCVYYNTRNGCKSRACNYEHACAYVKKGGKELCGGKHKKAEHREN